MKNLQSLLTEKGINALVSQEMLMVKGGKGKSCKKASVKSRGSRRSLGSKGTVKGGGAPAPIVYTVAP
jgi:hypothetical protein